MDIDLVGAADACQQALTEIARQIARIADSEKVSIADVYAIYQTARDSGVYEADSETDAPATCTAVASAGSEFLQLADAAERYQDSTDALSAWMDLIREAAAQWTTNRTVPEWSDRGGPYPYRL